MYAVCPMMHVMNKMQGKNTRKPKTKENLKGDIYLGVQRGEAGEPFEISGHMSPTTEHNDPCVLQASILLKSKTWDEQTIRHWG